MPRLLSLLVLVALLFLPGCGLTRKKMDAAAAQRIHTIALLDVAVTKQRTYFDPAAQFTSGLALGDVGALGYDVAILAPQSQFQKASPDPAYPSRLLTEELAAALEKKGFTVRRVADGPPSHRAEVGGTGAMNDNLFVKDYAKIPAGDADAVLDVVCVTFGYERFPFTQSDHPFIALAVRLVSPDGKTVHYAQGFAFAQKENHINDCVNVDADRKQFAAAWSDVFKDRAVLDKQVHIAAQGLAEALGRDMGAGK